ncbi:MAG: chromate transporter [Betaproteobacteria bacterium]
MASPESPQVDLKSLFRAFSAVGLSGFGGVLPFARRMLVEERRWLSADEFNYLQGLCQFLPGPNVVNLSVVVGARYGGIGGALAAVIGLLSGPVAVVLLLVQFYDAFGALPAIQGMLRGVAAAGTGLFLATAVRMAMAITRKARFLPFAGLVFLGIAWLRWPLPAVMLSLLPLSAAMGWWSLGDHADRR